MTEPTGPVYTIEFAPVAAREFRHLTRPVQALLQPVIDALAADPRPHNVVKLKDSDNLYRVRSGDYRIIYEIQDKALLVLIVRIANRREAYRRR